MKHADTMKTTSNADSLYHQMLVAIVQYSEDAIVSKTLEGIVTSWNPGAEKLFGYTAAEMIGKSITILIPPDRLEEEPRILARMRLGERIEHFDTIRMTKAGQLVNISLTLSPIKDHTGKIIGVSKIARNITAQKHAEQQLRASEERLQMAVETTRLGTWDYQPLNNLLYWSDECRKIYDMPKDVEVNYALFEQLIHPEDKDFATSTIAAVMDPASDGNYDIQYRILRYSDKKPRWIRAQGKVYFDNKRQPELFIGTVLDITEEKLKEQELKKNIFQFQRLADTVPVMIWTTRPDGNCYYLNELWYQYTGQEYDAALGYGWMDIIHPDDRAYAENVFFEGHAKQLPFNMICRIKRNDGVFEWMMCAAKPRFDTAGNYEGFTGAILDVDERKKAEEALRESEGTLSLALESAAMGTWILDFQTMESTYSGRCLQIFGFDPADHPNREDVLKRVYPDDLPSRTTAMEEAIKTGVLDYQFRMVKPGNGLSWIRVTGRVFYNNDGTPHKMLGTVIDITDQQNAFEVLQASESRLNKLADAMPQLVWIAEPDGNVTYYNNRISEYWGIRQDAKHISEWQPVVHPDDLEATRAAWNDAVSKKEAFSREHRIRMNDGSYRWHLSRGFPDKDANEHIVKWFGTATDIDAIKTYQQTLAESEERLRLAMEATKMGTWSVDLATGLAITSEQHREIMGYDDTENLTPEKYLVHIVPEDREELDRIAEQGLKDGRYEFEGRVQKPGKPLKWIKLLGKTIYDDNGKPVVILGTVRDITEEKNAANVILESEERFRIIANTAPVMIWMSGHDKFADFFNTSWLSFTGRTLEEESNEGWQENVHPDDLAHCIEVYNESYEQQKAFILEYRLRRADGIYRWILDNAVPRYTHDGRFIGFISACMDIDDEKRFNERLQASELLFKTITNVAPVGLWMTDEFGNNNYINDTWINWTGIKLHNHFNGGWMDSVLLSDKEAVYKEFVNSMNNREKYSTEFRFRRADGDIRWGLTEGFPYYEDNGKFGGYAGSVTDITERKQNELLKNDFLAVASHELKTPLTSIKAYAQLLSKTYDKANDAFLKNGLHKIENQVNKMTKLVTDFLNLSKLESEKFSLFQERFDINELVREIAIDIQMVAINHTILLEKKRSVFVNADKEKISQVVTNLLNNAVKYSPEDKDVKVSMVEENGWVTVSIADKGIGIKPGEHEKIFQRFYRSEFNNNISFSGFGIGLYISAEIIKRHDGVIGVNSEEGRGADFYFKLPVVP